MNRSFLAGVVKALDGSSPSGDFEVVLSAPTLDRDGEVIDAHAFDPLPDQITFDIDHGMSTATTVGSGVPTYEGDLLIVRGTFASIPRAQEVRTLVAEGHIRTTSVSYMNPDYEVRDGVRHIVKAELLNGAFVAVPSNREALVLASKGAGPAALPGRKAVAGSFEERREQVAEAVATAHPDAWWSMVIATFEDSVVYEIEGRDSVDRFQADYAVNADTGDITLTNERPVEVVEVIQPADSPDDTPEAKATAAPAAPAPPPAAVALGPRAAALAAAADVLLG